jgi:hypothetical protein
MSPALRSFAWLDDRRHLRVIGADGRGTPRTSELRWGMWAKPPEDEVHSWPTWSPAGDLVASFRLAQRGAQGMTCRVQIAEPDGREVWEVAELADRVPFYLQWSPDASSLAALTQSGDQLHLDLVDPIGERPLDEVVAASPLFFHHAPDGRLVLHIGEAEGPPRVIVVQGQERRQIGGLPASFCAPFVAGDRVIAAFAQGDGARLRAAPIDGEGPSRELLEVHGLAAFLPSPDGRSLAYAVARDGMGETYLGVESVDLATGARHVITESSLMAFFWLPDGSGIIGASRTRAGTVRWARIDLHGRQTHLAEVFPTRDLRFYLRFFEQFALSHPLVDAESQALVVAGGLVGEPDPRGTPRLWWVPLDGSGAEVIGEGVFGSFASARNDGQRARSPRPSTRPQANNGPTEERWD